MTAAESDALKRAVLAVRQMVKRPNVMQDDDTLMMLEEAARAVRGNGESSQSSNR